ncbi:hypothetical protein TW85_04020 [Marinomonas sp. S3726]|nr:hypothetical protein TW85_04020 [Marinomonas sp. S3726]
MNDGIIVDISTSQLNPTKDILRIGGSGRYLIPSLIDSHLSMFDPTYLENPLLSEVIPKGLLDRYKSDDGHWFHKYILQ